MSTDHRIPGGGGGMVDVLPSIDSTARVCVTLKVWFSGQFGMGKGRHCIGSLEKGTIFSKSL